MPLELNATNTTYVDKESTTIVGKITDGIMAPFGDGSKAYTVNEVRSGVLAYSALAFFFGARTGASAAHAGKEKVLGFIPLPPKRVALGM